jgi:hypothetical protein
MSPPRRSRALPQEPRARRLPPRCPGSFFCVVPQCVVPVLVPRRSLFAECDVGPDASGAGLVPRPRYPARVQCCRCWQPTLAGGWPAVAVRCWSGGRNWALPVVPLSAPLHVSHASRPNPARPRPSGVRLSVWGAEQSSAHRVVPGCAVAWWAPVACDRNVCLWSLADRCFAWGGT